jgi:hypothetical protein
MSCVTPEREAAVDISSLSSATTDAYLQYLTDGKSGNTQSSLFSSTDVTTTSADTTYLDEAAAGTKLTASEQQAANAELKDVLVGRLFDISA